MLSDDVPSRRRALRFLLVWGAIALVLFAISALITNRVLTETETRYAPHALVLAIYVPSNAAPTAMPRVDYREMSNGTALVQIHELPRHGSIYIGPLPPGMHCEDWLNRKFSQVPEYEDDPTAGGPVYRLSIQNAGGDMAICTMPPLTAAISFVDRRLDAQNYAPALSKQPPNEKPIAWMLDLSAVVDADRRQFIGGLPGPRFETDRLLDSGHPYVQAYWESRRLDSQRNILLVVIGALIALGAASLLEALRPFVDILVAGGPKKM